MTTWLWRQGPLYEPRQDRPPQEVIAVRPTIIPGHPGQPGSFSAGCVRFPWAGEAGIRQFSLDIGTGIPLGETTPHERSRQSVAPD